MSEVIITRATPEDSRDIITLIRQNDFSCGEDLPEGFVAKLDKAVIAYIGYEYTYGANAYVYMFVVNEVARGMGIGIALIKALVTQCKTDGIKRIEATVDHESTRAIKLYKELGVSLRPVMLIEAMVDDLSQRLEQDS